MYSILFYYICSQNKNKMNKPTNIKQNFGAMKKIYLSLLMLTAVLCTFAQSNEEVPTSTDDLIGTWSIKHENFTQICTFTDNRLTISNKWEDLDPVTEQEGSYILQDGKIIFTSAEEGASPIVINATMLYNKSVLVMQSEPTEDSNFFAGNTFFFKNGEADVIGTEAIQGEWLWYMRGMIRSAITFKDDNFDLIITAWAQRYTGYVTYKHGYAYLMITKAYSCRTEEGVDLIDPETLEATWHEVGENDWVAYSVGDMLEMPFVTNGRVAYGALFNLNGVYTIAPDKATEGTAYYGSGIQGIGLADGTVAAYQFYTGGAYVDGTLYVPATLQVWEDGVCTAEYRVSTVGTSWSPSIYVGEGETSDWAGVSKIFINEGVKKISQGAFTTWASATNLKEVSLPSTLKSIGAGAFAGCEGLETIFFNGYDVPTLDNPGWTDHFKSYSNDWDAIVKNCKVYVLSDYIQEAFNQDPWTYWTEFYNNGNVVVGTPITELRGDANGDGVIDMSDVKFIVNYILGTPDPSFNAKAADANQDGEIGMPDVMFIVNYILNGKFPVED